MRILITGGASGLGEAITRRFAQVASNTVYFTYHRSSEHAAAISRELKNTTGISCDFSNTASVEALIDALQSINPDVLIHNAYQGKFIDTYFHKTAVQEFEDSFKVNILPVISITQGCIALFRKKKTGTILTVLSQVLEAEPPVGASVYAAGKAYLEQLVKSWAVENKKFTIYSGAVSPGLMLTSLTSNIDERLLEQMKESSAHQHFLTTQEAADAIYALAAEPGKLNGKTVRIDPGKN